MNCESRYRLLLYLLSTLLFEFSAADETRNISQVLRDLGSDHVLLCLSAHPDDEDGATLAYYRVKFGVKTHSVFFTRGEGGQNEKGPELYEELGAIREEETERAARILGSDLSYLNFYDFGYSKTATETLRMWGGWEEVLRRLVHVIRKLKPDVIITNHKTMGGHGHHQAVAIAAIAAFDASADTSFHHEQFTEDGTDPWQPRKLFFRVSRRTGLRVDRYDVAIPVGEYNPLYRESYSQSAIRALREHVTQGMDKIANTMTPAPHTYYRLNRSASLFDVDTLDLFHGIDITLDFSAKVNALKTKVSQLSSVELGAMDIFRLGNVMNEATELLDVGNLSPLEHRVVSAWHSELGQLAFHSAGVQWRTEDTDWLVVPGQNVRLSITVQAGKKVGLDSLKVGFLFPSGWTWDSPQEFFRESVKQKEKIKLTAHICVPRDARLTYPRAKHLFDSMDGGTLGSAVVDYSVGGIWFRKEFPLPFEVAPHHVLDVDPGKAFVRETGLMLRYRVTNHGKNKTAGRVRAIKPEGWVTETAEFVIPYEDSSASGGIRVRPMSLPPPGVFPLIFETDWSSDTVWVSSFPVEVPRDLFVGIVESYDNTLENALAQLGVRYQKLREKDLKTADLSLYHTILIDMRAYLVRSDLVEANARVLEYVGDGGNLVVMYQKDIEWKSEYAPYPIELSRRRVSNETAPVLMLEPNHPLLQYPNRIIEEDWDGWVQERGLYFPQSHGSEYRQLLATADPDESLLTTGYLVAGYGAGSYIYTSFSWYRQLREAHPGAMRNLANMISYGLRESRRRGD